LLVTVKQELRFT